MKRLLCVWLVLFLGISLMGCGEQETVFFVSSYGVDLEVDSVEKTISDGKYVYKYEFSGDASAYQVQIRYPNGSTYWWNQSGMTGTGGWSDDYTESTYASGNVLVGALEAIAKMNTKRSGSGGGISGLILIVLGVLELLNPEMSWYLGYGWRFKDAEPSEAALVFARIGGVIAVIVGVVILFV